MASYPGTVAGFTTKVNNETVVLAEHPNSIQEELVAVQSFVGTSPHYSGTMTGTGFIATANYNHGTVSERIANVEKGLYAAINTNYVRKVGGDAITSSADNVKGLIIKGFSANQSANPLEIQLHDGTVVASFNPQGGLTDSKLSPSVENLYVQAVVFG